MSLTLLAICLLATVSLVKGDDVQLLTSASSAFSQRLYQKIAVNKPNVIYSPYSIHSALTMISLGARGETATEFSQALGLTSLIGSPSHQAYHDLNAQLNGVKEVKLHTANAIFVNPNAPIESQFINDVRTDYLATTSNFDLAAVGGPEKIINDFVKNKTEGLIHDIIPPGSIDGGTVMILVNTIFFNGTWHSKFVTSKTTQQNFQHPGGATSQVDMMYDERYVNIRRNVLGADVAELPFVGNRFSLYIALPHAVDGITAFESLLAVPANVDQLFEGLSSTRVKLSIPKFKTEATYELTAALKGLGIVKAFDPQSSNFQGISSSNNVYISDVIHKAVIEVTESGTVAAAVTAIGVITSIEIPPAVEVFKADHPFVYFLRDNIAQEILFQGKFSN
jgi:serpin B